MDRIEVFGYLVAHFQRALGGPALQFQVLILEILVGRLFVYD